MSEHALKNQNRFPGDLIDPSIKAGKEYNIAYAKAAYEQYTSNLTLVTEDKRKQMIKNKQYAEGAQDNNQYKLLLAHKDEKGEKKSTFYDLNYDIVSPIPKFRRIVLGLVDKLEFDIDFSAIDPHADEDRLHEKFKLWAEKKVNDLLAVANIKIDGDEPSEESMQFETMEDLEMFMSMGAFKLSYEIAMQSAVQLSLDLNGFKEVKKQVFEDLFDIAFAGIREYTTKSGVHKIRYVNPINVYIEMTRQNDCTKATRIGEILRMSIADVRAEAGDQISFEEYKKLVNMAAGKNGNPSIGITDAYIDVDSNNNWGLNNSKFDDYVVDVFDLSWFSVDESVYEKKENAAGTTITHKKPFGYKVKDFTYATENGEYYKTEVGGTQKIKLSKDQYYKEQKKAKRKVERVGTKMVYGCKWIVGTDMAYDFGLTTDMPRSKTNLKETTLPYHMYRLSNKSFVEEMIPFADGFMLSWLKIQNAKAMARPKGLMIEISSLQNMTLGKNAFTPLAALSVYNATGNIIYKGNGLEGMDHPQGSRTSPVQELQGGMGAEYRELIADLNLNFQMCRDVTGFNEAFDASTPNPETPVGSAKLAVEASNNAIQPMYSAFDNIFVRTGLSTARRFAIMSKYGKLKGYERALGSGIRKVIELAHDFSPYEWGCKTIARPTAAMRAELKNAALAAMNTRDASGQGQISYADYMFIMRVAEGGNLEYAEAIMAHRIEKRLQKANKQAAANSEMNGKIQQDSIMAKAKADKELADHKSLKKIEEINAQATADIRVKKAVGADQKEIAADKHATQKEVAATTSQAKLVTEAMKEAKKQEVE